jgi:hypothetical protein
MKQASLFVILIVIKGKMFFRGNENRNFNYFAVF